MSESNQKIVFIDEYGTPSIAVEKSGVTTHFIVAAVLIKPETKRDIEESLHNISAKYFSGGEIKSSSVGKNDKRRLAILNDFSKLPFHLHLLSVDKRAVFKSGGLIYKRSFMKYMHGRMYRFLFPAHPRIRLIIDQHGSEEFMNGFVKYIADTHVPPDLFSEYSYRFDNYIDEPILQIADFCAGSFARVYDPKKLTTAGNDILSALRPKVLIAEHWPPRLKGFLELAPEVDDIELKIKSLSRRSALKFLETNYDTTDSDILMRTEVLRYLLFRLDHDPPSSYIPTHEILKSVLEMTGSEITENMLRAKVIGPLRDEGVMVVSSSQGYKVADRILDVKSFVLEVDRRVVPQLKRLGVMRDNIYSTTSGELDILTGSFAYLEDAIKAVREPS